ISRIFLSGRRAYKMKRAVSLPYADFSTPALRLAFCEKEVELNSKTAPGLYLGVQRITREADGAIMFDGPGELIDAVVEMVRFDQQCLFDKMAAAGELTAPLMTRLARMIVDFHRTAPITHSGSGAANIAGVLDINEAGFEESHVFDATEVAAFNAAFRSRLAHHAELLDRRETTGKVR
ncbi:aminoglycoside phosphotransferase, partial [Rhizobiaceae sp. 2RAB30]